MKLRWDVDDVTVVELTIGGFSKTILAVNGTDIPSSLTARKKSEFGFDLTDGRHAVLAAKPQFAGVPQITLRLDGTLIVPTEKIAVKCSSCGAVVKPNDRFCGACGKAMPPAEHYLLKNSVKQATGAIWTLAVLFAISGVIFFFIARSQDATALARLSTMNPNDLFPKPVNGVTYTVSALHNEILWEQWSPLIVNFILAIIMVGLALWGKIAPLAAILVAAATYIVVVATNAIIAPQSLGQGVYLKIIVVLLLARGIKAGLALRSANA